MTFHEVTPEDRSLIEVAFAYIWEYRVKDERIEEFRRIYGPHGDWVKLFSRSSGFVRTDLYRDINAPKRFVTTDFWISKEARDQFRREFASEFNALDRRCESLTTEERFLGDFEIQPR
jgi:quinol monooxygenase YgiN